MTRTGNRNFARVAHDGIIFDSKLEFERYVFLKDQQKVGMIRHLKVHTKHRLELNDRPLLIRSHGYPNGRRSTWTDDFSYEVREESGTWSKIIEDVKGRDTYQERFKRGVFEMLTGQQIVVVTSSTESPRRTLPARGRKRSAIGNT